MNGNGRDPPAFRHIKVIPLPSLTGASTVPGLLGELQGGQGGEESVEVGGGVDSGPGQMDRCVKLPL